ncbi:zinc-binding dehydrogenase [Luteibacter sp. E-22]|uniref:zinc-binding dehydrogenase n=1 Tax=Luteibacter sp. E-22 TaxID=3404050 RepID=UPI003CFB96BF
MKAAWITNPRGGDLSISVGDTDAPVPRDDRIVVDVEAVGLTFAEPTWATNGTLSTEIVARVADGRIAVQIDRTYPLSDARKAFAEAESRARRGKTVLLVRGAVGS